MPEEKKPENELSEKEIDKVSGGSVPKHPKKCQNCPTLLPYNWPGSLCKKCLESLYEKDKIDIPMRTPPIK